MKRSELKTVLNFLNILCEMNVPQGWWASSIIKSDNWVECCHPVPLVLWAPTCRSPTAICPIRGGVMTAKPELAMHMHVHCEGGRIGVRPASGYVLIYNSNGFVICRKPVAEQLSS